MGRGDEHGKLAVTTDSLTSKVARNITPVIHYNEGEVEVAAEANVKLKATGRSLKRSGGQNAGEKGHNTHPQESSHLVMKAALLKKTQAFSRMRFQAMETKGPVSAICPGCISF